MALDSTQSAWKNLTKLNLPDLYNELFGIIWHIPMVGNQISQKNQWHLNEPAVF